MVLVLIFAKEISCESRVHKLAVAASIVLLSQEDGGAAADSVPRCGVPAFTRDVVGQQAAVSRV